MAELIWKGKYDDQGHRVAPLRVALPFQTVETVNESAQERQTALDLFSRGRDPEWRNRLIWGDKKYVLPSLLDEFAGQVTVIYIDPPFNVGADFSFTAAVPEGPEDEEAAALTFTKQPSILEMKAYRDTWGGGLDGYLQWFYETVTLLRELLAEDGSIYVHCDWRVSGYIWPLLDEIFGKENHQNELIWHFIKGASGNSRFGRKHQTIYWYSKSKDAWLFNRNDIGVDYNPETIARARRGEARYSVSAEELEARGKNPGDVWSDVNPIQGNSIENTGYATQKPEALLERILRASSNGDGLVLDCFVGSGTTAAVAEKLGRRWIACDLSRFAIHTTRKRLLGIENVRPFVVQNLGKYERQQWQRDEFAADAAEAVLRYRRFVLDLYGATPLSGYAWLHGARHGRLVHVGSVDAPVSVGDVANMVADFRRAVGTGADAPTTAGIDVLGWDFAFELNEVARQQVALAKVDLRFLRIPRDVMDKRAVEQGDIKFFELAALSVEAKTDGRELTLTLTDFIIPPDDVPQDVQAAITHWSQWIDYWAVDWDNKDDTFHNEWQTYRTRQNRSLQLSTTHRYDTSGEYTVVAKVIDILGNDTTRTLKVKV